MTAIPTIDTARLILRAPGPQDFPAMRAFYASDRSRFVGGPKDAEGAWRQLATEIGHWALCGYGRWIVEDKATGTVCGIVGLWNPEGWPEPEIGWDLFDGFEGRGYATEAAEAARAHAYETLGWRTVISLVDPANRASARVAERLCARPDGEFTHAVFGTVIVYRHPVPEVCL
ncbi:GNAT family N-acetyltransferase [Rhodovulum adriaticum]|uniref:RimJ/RimL family protein N-acetyltransferase n=1 Tax=Rhodovulum adriaticum TaxID=35804 RepID=A0A4R2NJY1_RHOAD|nr:GNAT family N-acetyltransferase [Rhodovulum adriaticum]MBK1635902.1 GNAT family N-acetyltransferase [Rhodovulum adriaticum]TCP21444.1 RimJ/RimL family protein N-acetyltransferase [Rhodovulum adriaticum]